MSPSRTVPSNLTLSQSAKEVLSKIENKIDKERYYGKVGSSTIARALIETFEEKVNQFDGEMVEDFDSLKKELHRLINTSSSMR